jgi:hypothetical protein
MTKRYGVVGLAGLVFVLLGCSSAPLQQSAGGVGTSCIGGKVYYGSPVDSKEVPYPGAVVSAWAHGIQQGLVEVKADNSGNYCLDIPLGTYAVDLRVWGYLRLEETAAKDYTCKGSADNIDLGTSPTKCGTSLCKKMDIHANCGEFYIRRER